MRFQARKTEPQPERPDCPNCPPAKIISAIFTSPRKRKNARPGFQKDPPPVNEKKVWDYQVQPKIPKRNPKRLARFSNPIQILI